MAMRNPKIYGQNHIKFQHNDSISYRELIPQKTKAQIKHKQFPKCWVPNNPGNSKVHKIDGVALVEKHIAEGNKEEAQRLLNKIVFEQQIKPQLNIIAEGVEKDLITFTAEDIW